MNVWILTGRLGRDAELRTTQSGEKVLSFRVANDVGFGERRTTNWVDCSLWGRRGESLAQYLTKGTQVTVSGELSLREYTRSDGTPGQSLSVRVQDIELMGGRGDGAAATGGGSYGGGYREEERGGYGGGREGGPSGAGRTPPPDDLDDEIPF